MTTRYTRTNSSPPTTFLSGLSVGGQFFSSLGPGRKSLDNTVFAERSRFGYKFYAAQQKDRGPMTQVASAPLPMVNNRRRNVRPGALSVAIDNPKTIGAVPYYRIVHRIRLNEMRISERVTTNTGSCQYVQISCEAKPADSITWLPRRWAQGDCQG